MSQNGAPRLTTCTSLSLPTRQLLFHVLHRGGCLSAVAAARSRSKTPPIARDKASCAAHWDGSGPAVRQPSHDLQPTYIACFPAAIALHTQVSTRRSTCAEVLPAAARMPPAATSNGSNIVSGIDSVPVTKEHRPPKDLDSKVKQPGNLDRGRRWRGVGLHSHSNGAAVHGSTQTIITWLCAGVPRANISVDAEHPTGGRLPHTASHAGMPLIPLTFTRL